MSLTGSLQQIDVPNLIELTKQMPSACLKLLSHGREWVIYTQNGEVVHAANDARGGLPVLYEALACHSGVFFIEAGVQPPMKTIDVPWTSILLEGLQQMDEQTISLSSLAEQQQEDDFGFGDDFGLADDGMSITYENGNMRMSGRLNGEGPLSVLEIAQQRPKPTRVSIRNEGDWYEMYVVKQNVVHARTWYTEGVEAFYEMMACQEGIFVLEENVDATTATIKHDWGTLGRELKSHLQNKEEGRKHVERLLKQMAADMGEGNVQSLCVFGQDGYTVAQVGDQPLSAVNSALFVQTAQMLLNGSGACVNEWVLKLDGSSLVGRRLDPSSSYSLIGEVNTMLAPETVQLIMTSYAKRLLNVI